MRPLPKGDRPLWKKPAAPVTTQRRGAVEIDRPGAKPGRPGKPQRKARLTAPGDAPPKTEYKPGWAKPKKKPVAAKAGVPKRRSGAAHKAPGAGRPSGKPTRG